MPDLKFSGDALAFTAKPPHQQGLRQGAPIGYGSELPPTANQAQCLCHLLLPIRTYAGGMKPIRLEKPALLPIRTYAGTLDGASVRNATARSFDKGLSKGLYRLAMPCLGKLWIRAAGGAAEAARGLGRRRSWRRGVVPVAASLRSVATVTAVGSNHVCRRTR